MAFAEAVASLTHRERNLLRHQVLDHMTIDQIGVVYRATAARWLNKARARLVKSCRQRLAERLGIPDQELDSLIALVESRLYESLSGFLRKSAP